MIYFVQAKDGGPVKIGTTKLLNRRLVALRAFLKREVVVLGVLPGTHKQERAIQKQFSSVRVKGEWFEPSHDLLSYIKENAQPWTNERFVQLGIFCSSQLHRAIRLRAARSVSSVNNIVQDLIAQEFASELKEIKRADRVRLKAAASDPKPKPRCDH